MTVTPDLRAIGAPRQPSRAGQAPRTPQAGDTSSTARAAASSDLLRSVFRLHAAGVAVITAHGDRPVGFTATSLTSVAADPPLLSFGVGTASSSWPVLSEAEHIGVHILGEHQHALAATFARSGADRFGGATRWSEGPEGVPVLDGVLAWLVCRVVARVPAGDHRIVIAEPVAGGPAGEGRPLLYHQGRFNALRD
ncbi:flavin reductase family protein [Streptomyces sp. NPDC090127]|uniref:flavin reductase family protein n=1 Tax=Streptomyces sp. NPDC090127 TaxID=3365953 RepID=UPI003827C90A